MKTLAPGEISTCVKLRFSVRDGGGWRGTGLLAAATNPRRRLGARVSARFTGRHGQTPEPAGPLPGRMLKRRERRTQPASNVPHAILQLSA